MKFIVNTSIDPHFCFFVDEKNETVDLHTWENRRLDGKEVFAYLEKHLKQRSQISFVGGISGPGGFSSLRSGAGIINAIAVAQDIKTHQVRADQWIAELLGNDIPFILNSFGDGVFLPKGEKLERISIGDAVLKFKGKTVYVDLLPEEKKSQFSNQYKANFSLISGDSLKTLTALLRKEAENDLFIPTYEINAVKYENTRDLKK